MKRLIIYVALPGTVIGIGLITLWNSRWTNIIPDFARVVVARRQKTLSDMAARRDDRRWRSYLYGEEGGASTAIDGGDFQAAVDDPCEIWDNMEGHTERGDADGIPVAGIQASLKACGFQERLLPRAPALRARRSVRTESYLSEWVGVL